MRRTPRHQDLGGAGILFFSEVALILGCFYLASQLDQQVDPYIYFAYEGGMERLLFATATILAGLYFQNLYSKIRVESRALLLQELCAVFGVALLSQGLVEYLKPGWILPRWLMMFGAAFSLAAIFAWRMIYSRYFLNIVRRQRIIFVGRNRLVEEIAREIENVPDRGYQIMGFVDSDFESLSKTVTRLRPDRVVVGMEPHRELLPIAGLLKLRYAGMEIEEANTTFERVHRRVSTRDLNPLNLVFSSEMCPPQNSLRLQHALDRVIALFVLVVSSPLLLAVAAGLWLQSRDGVMVRSTAIGKDSKPFTMLRFRKTPGLGSLYQRLHLHAIPGLINVVRGEMSLVGPRPETPEMAARKATDFPLYDYRYNVYPGMTGWAQVNMNRYEQANDPSLSLEYDLYYVKHMSQALNAYILMTTVKNRLVWADQD